MYTGGTYCRNLGIPDSKMFPVKSSNTINKPEKEKQTLGMEGMLKNHPEGRNEENHFLAAKADQT